MLDIAMCIILLRLDNKNKTFEHTLLNNFSSDVIGVVKNCGDVTTIIGKQSQKEITKRDLQIVDQSGMSVNLTLWGADVSTVLGCLLTGV